MKKENLLKHCLKLCKKTLVYNFVFSFFINVLMLSTSIYSLQVLDRVLSSGSFNTLLMLSLIMITIYVILAGVQIVRSFTFNHIANWLDKNISTPLLEVSISYNGSTKGSQNLRDLNTIKSFLTGQPITHLFDAPWSVVYFIVIFYIHWINGMIVVAGAAILFILALVNEKATKKQLERVNEANVISMNKIDSIARNSEVINAMGMKSSLSKAWQEINHKHIATNNELQRRSSIITHVTKSFRLFIQMSTMAVGAILVINNQMSAGGIIATSILAGKALAPFDAAVSIYKSVINSKKSYDRLTNSLEEYNPQMQSMQLPEPEGEIIIEKLFYQLPNSDRLIIKGIEAQIKPGEIIAIIGSSAAGKTTIARLLTGILKPTKGAVRLDGADIAHQDSEVIGKYLGYLPQDVELFNAGIKENIARMNQEAEDENIVAAAQFTGIDKMILQLPQGYETNALSLSAGQRQRIALARAFYGMPKFVVLDEPNSNLDAIGEQALAQTIQNAKKAGITTIIISHRSAITANVDKILILKEGQIQMFDDAKTVLKKISGANNDAE